MTNRSYTQFPNHPNSSMIQLSNFFFKFAKLPIKTKINTIADNTHRTTWDWPATTQDDDEALWDRRQGDPSRRARGSLSPLRMHCKRDNIVPRRCSPPDTPCRSRSMSRGTNTLETDTDNRLKRKRSNQNSLVTLFLFLEEETIDSINMLEPHEGQKE